MATTERRHRNAIDRAHQATRRAIDATAAAQTAAERAEVAAAAEARRHNPATVKNRIDKMEADQRGLDGHRRVVARTATTEYVDEFGPATGAHREQIIARMAQRADEITYWKRIYSAQQAAGIASAYSRDTIAKGDLIKHRGHWYPVVRANAKTVSVQMHPGATWTNTIGYHEISDHQPGQEVHSA